MTHLWEFYVTIWQVMHVEFIIFKKLENLLKNINLHWEIEFSEGVLFYPLIWITQALNLLQQVHG